VRARLQKGLADIRLIGTLGAVFGGLALALAGGGIYGVVSYETSRRRCEYGVRLALGASPSRISGLVLWQTSRVSAIGVLLGVVSTAALTPVLRRWVFGISPLDPLTFAGVAALLCATTTVAALAPALRASRSDPMSSLRAE
jgi:putative ABC transport system permease protein